MGEKFGAPCFYDGSLVSILTGSFFGTTIHKVFNSSFGFYSSSAGPPVANFGTAANVDSASSVEEAIGAPAFAGPLSKEQSTSSEGSDTQHTLVEKAAA